MLKENGRFKPADKKELAGLKGKSMVCSNCGEKFTMDDVQFASSKCPKCGNDLTDSELGSLRKATGN